MIIELGFKICGDDTLVRPNRDDVMTDASNPILEAN